MDSSLLRAAVSRITISSKFGPTYVLDDPFAPAPPAPPNPYLALMKPMISVDIKDVGTYDVAPWGKPGPSQWPVVSGVGVAVGGAALLGASYKIARWIFG